MDQGLLVLVLSILVFVLGAVFINYSVKRDESKEAAQNAASTETTQVQAAAETKKAA